MSQGNVNYVFLPVAFGQIPWSLNERHSLGLQADVRIRPLQHHYLIEEHVSLAKNFGGTQEKIERSTHLLIARI